MHIMQNTVLSNKEIFMERVYKVLKRSGSRNIVTGILLIVAGIAFGVLNIVTGAKLLHNRRNILF